MSNPFDQADAQFLVLRNAPGQHSLWPAFLKVPAGWVSVFGPQARPDCLDYVESNWHDLRPLSAQAR